MRSMFARVVAAAGLAALLAGPTLADDEASARIDAAIAQLDSQIRDLMAETSIPGLALAVVRDGVAVVQQGYGIRNLETGEPVTVDTVFQLASVSKPIGATVVASVVGDGVIGWDTKVREIFPEFALADPWVSAHVTIGDLYAHRSGLPDHAGDDIEQLDFTQAQIFAALAQLPLHEFRQTYAYTNYGLTLGAEAAAEAAGKSWADLSEDRLYVPLGMTSTSSRFADFEVRDKKAIGHVIEDGVYVPGPGGSEPGQSRWSSAYNADRTSPAAGVSSSVSDLSHWLSFMLAGGQGGTLSIPGPALARVVTPKTIIADATALTMGGSHYGYGFMVSTPHPGHRVWSHSGAFAWGASSSFSILPDDGVAIVVLANATPNGVAETITAQFADLVMTGEITQDWWSIYRAAFAEVLAPQGRLVGLERPADPRAARPLADYAGRYESEYFGALEVRADGDSLVLKLGPQGQVSFVAEHWDGDTFAFPPFNDAQMLGSLSAVDFFGDRVVIEAYDGEGMGTFTRIARP